MKNQALFSSKDKSKKKSSAAIFVWRLRVNSKCFTMFESKATNKKFKYQVQNGKIPRMKSNKVDASH